MSWDGGSIAPQRCSLRIDRGKLLGCWLLPRNGRRDAYPAPSAGGTHLKAGWGRLDNEPRPVLTRRPVNGILPGRIIEL